MNGRQPTARASCSGLAVRTLWSREIIRFVRQKSRVVGALGTPLVFWLVVGGGVGRSFQIPGVASSMSYLEFSFPGALAAVLMFTAVFSTISIIEDRREGFLQSVLVAPVSRASIVMGKLAGAATLAVGQAALFLCLGPLGGIPLTLAGFAAGCAAMTLVAFSVSALGFAIAWRMESTQGFHAVMNLFLMPMLILSGAFFPPAGSAAPLRWLMYANPLTYAVSLVRWSLYVGQHTPAALHPFPWTVALVVSTLFAALAFCLAVVVARRDSTFGA